MWMLVKPIVHLPDEYLPAADQLPGELKWIASVVEEALPGMGVRITLILAQRFNGHIYFRRADDFIRKWRDDHIRAEYDAGGIRRKDLVVKTGLSLSQINRILDTAPTPSQDELKEKQMRLF